MTEAARRLWPALALAWLAAVLALGVHQAGFWREAKLDSDVMALLPGVADDPLLAAANARIADGATRQVVVVLRGADWEATRAAAKGFVDSLASSDAPLRRMDEDAAGTASAIDFFRPARRGLLTSAQRQELATADPQALVDRALAQLYGPGAGSGLTAWQDDPLGLWPAWWQARAGNGLGQRDGWLAVRRDGRDAIVLRFESGAPAFQLDGASHLGDALDRADEAATREAGGALEILHGGVPLHAEAAAVQASHEVNTIGLGSLLAVLVLVWLAFRSPRPILLVALSLLVGCAAGVSVTALVFGQVHLLTLVFGASLVGVAEDYGIHYFASRQAQPELPPRRLMRRLLPGLGLALVTSVLAYLALGIAPFPGLRQMAVFSAAGLAAACLTVVLWFPWLDGGRPQPSGLARAIGASLARWPRWRATPAGWGIAALALAFIAGGLLQTRVDDDLRSLRNSPPALLADEIAIGRLLGLPSPAQYFLVSAADEEQLLQAEEALADRLQSLVEAGRLGGFRALSSWVPSARRQAEDAALSRRIETPVLAQAAELLGEERPSATPDPAPLRLQDWLRQPGAAAVQPLWLGRVGDRVASVVLLEGLGAGAPLDDVAALADVSPGLRWVDRTRDISAVLGHYRREMGALLLAGYLAVAVALGFRFRRQAWRALLPTALAAGLSLATLGWLGVPLQLFGVLAQLLLLGMGVDYGIFLLEHRGDPGSWLAVSIGAASTLLAFGLLSLSATPALHSFGLSLLLGIGLVWALSPCFRPLHRDPVDELR